MVNIGKTKETAETPKKKTGRKSVYEERIKPHLEDITKWTQTMTDADIVKMLGVSRACWCKYKAERKELKEAIKKGRELLIRDFYSTLIRKAQGFQYTEKKTIKEIDPNTGALVVTREEEYTRTALPDVAALHLLLKNYDTENWAENPQALELKRQELEIQKQKAENAAW